MTLSEVEKLVSQFVTVDQIKIPRQADGLGRGMAFVYLKDAGDVEKCIDYVDGRHLRGRQIR
jgi:hypothetical protein